MQDIEAYYDKMIQEVSEERYDLILKNPLEAERFMEEVINEMACHSDYIYEQMKDKNL